MTLIEQLTAEAFEAIEALDVTLATLSEPLPGLDPDVEAMVTRPAATVAGSVNLLDAVRDAKWFGDIHEMSRGRAA